MTAVLAIVLWVAFGEYFIYINAKSSFPAQSRGLRSELWWTTAFISAPLCLLSWMTGMVVDFDWWDPIILLINILIWWFWIVKDKDRDDRWKKRRKKAMAAIKEVGGKLVIVPLPHPA